MKPLTNKDIKGLAARHGLNLLWAGPPPAISSAVTRLQRWQESGFAGEMGYMLRPPQMYVDIANFLPEVKSVILVTVHYEGPLGGSRPEGHGRVARYAWGRDYHRVLKRKLKALMMELQKLVPHELTYRIFADAVPLLERAFAERAGLGFIGKNSMLIQPGAGSYFFIGEVVTNLPIEEESPNSSRGSCGECTRCITSCPTNAIVWDRVVDARKCISYLTIEKRGSLSHWEREAIGEWVFGCDLCQEVCPFNHIAHKGRRSINILSEFNAEEGCGPFLSLDLVLSIRTSEEFTKRFAGTPLMRPGRSGLLRNASIVAANTGCGALEAALTVAAREDSCEVVRQHALWALFSLFKKCNIGSRKRLEQIIMEAERDSGAHITGEVKWIKEQLQ
ncbi:MAG: tRNA epoxyqueuosine(34) reductase QueG [Deltaproteobacteria bacterium]|nr:tRNA epoxyqueuosine(34) reductase QueG [Deltaproteobacteria bacterium]